MTTEQWNEKVDVDKKVYDDLKRKFAEDNGVDQSKVDEFASKVFDIAFDEGQRYVWYARSGFGSSGNDSPDYGWEPTN
jgi:hypothetical protein